MFETSNQKLELHRAPGHPKITVAVCRIARRGRVARILLLVFEIPNVKHPKGFPIRARSNFVFVYMFGEANRNTKVKGDKTE